ncbi:cysteine proteinase [Bimuria novae-zelandiae CBS 107.79]|uniref:Cysteine proteinase n=1 Tax=Bimuria novae-zelandiae CBS 107.79 TaxID=1447943 RepID=A0A6A5VJ55_9PLEO|nr:cysteine proteinase [Bimuria novae-zelandiae CBS 107.79]
MNPVPGDDDFKGPQEELNAFWENLITKKPRKVTNIFPPSLYANLLPPQRQPGLAKGKNAAESYEAAAKECRARVEQIIRECERTNEKFTDPDFDIESDMKKKNCLEGLMASYDDPPLPKPTISPAKLGEALATLADSNFLASPSMVVGLNAAANILETEEKPESTGPGSVHRIDWIFDNPSFTVDSFSSSDVKQGSNGDCWFIAALATLCSNPSLMEKVCVAADERCQECGVYGFVFYRDGEWIWTVVDDNLYVRHPDFDAYGDEYDPTGVKERKYKRNNQTGSDALYFAMCADQNETWLPLLEKAYAKAHGDYQAISGGISGEAVEDLTGGVTTKIKTNRVLSKERLWQELKQVNQQFLFSASSPGSYGDDSDARQGLALSHAYSIIKAVDEKDEDGTPHRLVLIRNPWGERMHAGMGEWNGAWADGSKEWTPYWMKTLNHRFGNDGLFWMSYDDLCRRFDLLDRTRLFDDQWTVVQSWTSVSVAWVTGYLSTKFVVEIKKAGPTVFVLCQLDERYFRGLEEKYSFDLHFVLQEEGAPAGEHIVRARGAWFGNRSVSAEVTLKPGKYEVVPKIAAERNAEAPDVYEVVTKVADRNPQKLRQIGLNYDIANAKGIVQLTAEEKKEKEEKQKVADEKKRKEKEEADKERAEFQAWKKEKREREEKAKAEAEKASEGTPVPGDKAPDAKDGDPKLIAEQSEDEVAKETTTAGAQQTPKNDKKEETDKTEPPPTDEPPSKLKDNTTSSDPPPEPPAPENPLADRTIPPSHLPRPPPSAYAGSYISGPPSPQLGPSRPRYYGDAGPPPRLPRPAVQVGESKWNAICVLGLRVYSQDPEVSIKLVRPMDAEEGALLDVDGAGAGATVG